MSLGESLLGFRLGFRVFETRPRGENEVGMFGDNAVESFSSVFIVLHEQKQLVLMDVARHGS